MKPETEMVFEAIRSRVAELEAEIVAHKRLEKVLNARVDRLGHALREAAFCETCHGWREPNLVEKCDACGGTGLNGIARAALEER